MIAFGPVPSRRLGRSLGINNIPLKMCSYSCVYCQIGRTNNMQVERLHLYKPEQIYSEVRNKIEEVKRMGDTIEYLTFVANGEPSLDIYLGRAIDLLKPLGIKIAVITNGFLLFRKDIREILAKTDWISLKVDSTIDEIWHKINRPHGCLQLDSILNGMIEFKKVYHGKLMTETMLVRGVNDDYQNLSSVAQYLSLLKPDKSYLSIPTRPPTENWVLPPKEEVLIQAYQIFRKKLDHVEYLIGYEGNFFSCSGDIQKDLLSITAVHPMREDAVKELLFRSETDWSLVNKLIKSRQLLEMEFEGEKFYMRRYPKRPEPSLI